MRERKQNVFDDFAAAGGAPGRRGLDDAPAARHLRRLQRRPAGRRDAHPAAGPLRRRRLQRAAARHGPLRAASASAGPGTTSTAPPTTPTELGWLLGYSPYHAVARGHGLPGGAVHDLRDRHPGRPAARPQDVRGAAARDDVGRAGRCCAGRRRSATARARSAAPSGLAADQLAFLAAHTGLTRMGHPTRPLADRTRRSPESIYGDDTITVSDRSRRRTAPRLLRRGRRPRCARSVYDWFGLDWLAANADALIATPARILLDRRARRRRAAAAAPRHPPADRPHRHRRRCRRSCGRGATGCRPHDRDGRQITAAPHPAGRGDRLGAAQLRLDRGPGHRRRAGARRARHQPRADRRQRRRRRRRARLRRAEPGQGLHRRDRDHPRGPVRRRRRRRPRRGQRHRRGRRAADHPAARRQRRGLVRPQRRGAPGRQQEPGLRPGGHRHAGRARHRPRARAAR